MQGDDEHKMKRSIGVSSSQVPQLQLLDDNLEESEGAPERSPDCVIVKEKDPASDLSRRLTMEEENVSEVTGPSSSKHSLPSISEEANQNDWNTILSSSMERGRTVSHRSSDSEDWSFLHSPDYYEKDSYKNMKWDDDETATNWSRRDSRGISRTSSSRSEIPILSTSNPLYNIEKDLVELRRKMTSLLIPQRNKVRVVPQGMRVQELLRLVDKELELARNLPEVREVWPADWWRRRNLKQSIRKLQERAGNMVSQFPYMLSQFEWLTSFGIRHWLDVDRIRRNILLKSHGIIGVEGYDISCGRLVVAIALSEALNLVVCFDTVIWVTVSDCPTVTGIRKEIAKGLGISLPDELSGSENNRVMMNNILANMRFLLVLDDLQFYLNPQEIGIPHASILSESGSMVLVITKYDYNITSAQNVIHVKGMRIPDVIKKGIQFVLNPEEGIKWYHLDEVGQLHRLLYGDHLFHRGSGISSSSNVLQQSKSVSDLLTGSLEIIRCRDNVLSMLEDFQVKYVDVPRALHPESWFVNVDRVLGLLRKLQKGEAPPPTLMESMIQLQREGQILENSFKRNQFVREHNRVILEKLCLDNGDRKITAITGERGIGKTRLLAQSVVEQNFLCRKVVWITVSNVVTCTEVQEQIAAQLTMFDFFTKIQEKPQQRKVRPAVSLYHEYVVLIFDDVRSILDLNQIKMLGVPILQLPNIKIVMTSRHKEICKEMGAEVVFEVPLLSVEESKRLVRNIVGENYKRMDIVNKFVELYGGGLPRRLVHIGNTIKDATVEDLTILLDHPLETISKFSVGDHDEDEVCQYIVRRKDFNDIELYCWDQITKALCQFIGGDSAIANEVLDSRTADGFSPK